MTIAIEQQGQRVYFIGDTYAAKDRIKSLGAHWDGDRRAWWVGATKEEEARQLAEQLTGESQSAPSAPKAKQNPADIRLTGKGRYKGREYYAGAVTRDGQRVRLLTLPNAEGNYLDFWAPCSEVEQTKEYRPREHTYRGRTETRYTTLGGIADFVAAQRGARERGEPVCAECGRAGELVEDLEDGLFKHRGCCDIAL